jgi:8-amino-7-oxononanoate synthase
MGFEFIQEALQERRAESLLRARNEIADTSTARFLTYKDAKQYLNFASNDYLGLGSKLKIQGGLTGSRSSALVTGYKQCHKDFEALLCKHFGYESAILFSTGFSANSSVIKSLFSQSSNSKAALDSAIFQDKLNHASLIDGALQSDAKHIRFNHNDMGHLRQRLEKSKAANKLIISEGVFSMDGDSAPLQQLVKLKQQHNAWLMLDDAHSFGVLGDNGLGSVGLGCKPEILVITFGKAMACQGAAVLASQSVIDFLLQFNRDYIYSTSMSPLMVQAAEQQFLRVLDASEQRQHLFNNIKLFKQLCCDANIPVMPSETAIQPVVLGSAENALNAQAKLKELSIWLTAIRPPTVPHNTARLRITITAAHTYDDIEKLVRALKVSI